MKRTRLSRISAIIIMGAVLMSLVSACSGGASVAYTASIGIAKEASIAIDIPYERATILPINTNSINFFEGHLDAFGDIQFSVEGKETRHATLSENVPENLDLSALIPLWSMRFSTQIPLSVELTNAGSLNADLSPFANLTHFNYTQNAGDAMMILPGGENLEAMSITLNEGALNIVTPASANLTSDIAVNGGEMRLTVPFEGSVKLNFVSETAEITLPESYSASTADEGFVASYVSAQYDAEVDGVTFNIDASAGSLLIQYREPPAPEEETTDADAPADETATDAASEETTPSAETDTDNTASESQAADSDDTSNENAESESTEVPATVLEAVRDVSELETFIQAVSSAELKDALSAEGPITVFAPTNEAFVTAAESLAMGVEGLLEETTTLSIYLQFHVVEGNILASDITDGMRLTSLQGSDLVFSIDENGVVTVNGAEVITTDIVAENGVIHIIDAVLIPE